MVSFEIGKCFHLSGLILCFQALLQQLRETRLPMSFPPRNLYDYTVPWHPDGITFFTHRTHVLTYCADIQVALEECILSALKSREAESKAMQPCLREAVKHWLFAKTKAASFVGRELLLGEIAAVWSEFEPQGVASATSTQPFVVVGESGSGKTALMAVAALRCRTALCDIDACVISRFVGVTPASSSGTLLLSSCFRARWLKYSVSCCLAAYSLVRSLIEQIAAVYDCSCVNNGNLPDSYKSLCVSFPQYLAVATKERPIVIFLDSLVRLDDLLCVLGVLD